MRKSKYHLSRVKTMFDCWKHDCSKLPDGYKKSLARELLRGVLIPESELPQLENSLPRNSHAKLFLSCIKKA